jgi:Tfp pilus assembly protein PilV
MLEMSTLMRSTRFFFSQREKLKYPHPPLRGTFSRREKGNGFTFLEVLISCLLVSVSVLSLYGLQIKNQQILSNHAFLDEAESSVSNIREIALANSKLSAEQAKEILMAMLPPNPAIQITTQSTGASQATITASWEKHTYSLTVLR